MKVCVFGAGAVGGHIAARLVLGGAETAAILRGPALDAVRRNGIMVRTEDGNLHARVTATDDPAALGPQDAVIVTVKGPALPSVAAGIAPLLRADTPVIFAMNGLPWWYFHKLGGRLDGRRLPTIDPDGALWRAVGPERAVGGVVYSAVTVIEPGLLELAGHDIRLIIGRGSGAPPPILTAVAAALDKGGMSARVTGTIRDDIWSKLIQNMASSCLALVTGLPAREIYSEPDCVAAGRRLLAEGSAIARALGATPEIDVEAAITRLKTLDHKSSALQDLERGRTVEMDGLFEVPLELARLCGVVTPTLDLLSTLAKLRLRAAGLY